MRKVRAHALERLYSGESFAGHGRTTKRLVSGSFSAGILRKRISRNRGIEPDGASCGRSGGYAAF